MPHIKPSRQHEPLWKEWDKKADKQGLRHTVYSVNGDEFTGEWLANKKHGKTYLFVLILKRDALTESSILLSLKNLVKVIFKKQKFCCVEFYS